MNHQNSYHIQSLYEQYKNGIRNNCSKEQDEFHTPLLNSIQPLKPYRIAPIHRLTQIEHLLNLIPEIEKTKTFTIHTERHWELNMVTLIEIELVQVQRKESIVLYLELLHLPSPNTLLFSVIRTLINKIFHPSKRIIVWSNDNKEDLQILVLWAYLSKCTFDETYLIVLQGPFKVWYNKTFKHLKKCYVPSFDVQDHCYCSCPYRPYKNVYDQWTLEAAIEYTFGEFIHKPNGNLIDYQQNIIYHVHRGLAMAKLLMAVELDWSSNDLSLFNRFHRK
ncbi:unnamed protein product [Rotaria sp. Silwood1]|nr:unnamed protein product [Rotaria sp. Silwood1]CAF4518575.1 unnamed protein product [Rotaria sp. Silwood1]CAF4818799.1 unnamed protein product [Rotaria sp. Silwood1]CAF5107998.1 unnamed protein product [Rotaria sp. Silwood1]